MSRVISRHLLRKEKYASQTCHGEIQEHGGLLVLRGLEELTAGQGDLGMCACFGDEFLSVEKFSNEKIIMVKFHGLVKRPGFDTSLNIVVNTSFRPIFKN